MLQYEGTSLAASLTTLILKLKEAAGNRSGDPVVVAAGLGDATTLVRTDSETEGIDDIDAFIYRRTTPPSWAKRDSSFEDTQHQLVIAIRRGNLIAVHCDSSLRDTLQRWL